MSHPTNATRRNYVSTVFQLFQTNHKKTFKNNYFPFVFPWKGTLTLTPGMGGEGDRLGPPKSPRSTQINKTYFVSYLFPPEGNFDIDAGDGDGGDHLGPQQSPTISKK